MDIHNHPKFVAFLNAMPRTEIALHGLHHINRGRSVSVEFQRQDRATCAAIQTEALQIFEESGLRQVNYLDRLFGDIEERYGEAIESTTLDRLATSLSASCPTSLIEKPEKRRPIAPLS